MSGVVVSRVNDLCSDYQLQTTILSSECVMLWNGLVEMPSSINASDMHHIIYYMCAMLSGCARMLDVARIRCGGGSSRRGTFAWRIGCLELSVGAVSLYFLRFYLLFIIITSIIIIIIISNITVCRPARL